MAAAFASASLFAAAVPASAAVITLTSVLGGQPISGPGVAYENFNNCSGTSNCNLSIGGTASFVPDAQGLTGAISGIAAAPYITNSNDNLFGGSQASGPDVTNYLSSGTGGWKISFNLAVNEVSLLWGSVDNYNTLSFYDTSNNLIGSVTGLDVNALANGDQGALGTFTAIINSTVGIGSMIGSSTQYAFEADNLAVRQMPVPEPSTLAMFATILAGLGFMVSRRKRNDFASGMTPA
jgi:hypothetical protein